LKTKKLAIKNLLLFKKKPLYWLINKRIRAYHPTAKFVNSVTITVALPEEKSDSVDVYIRVLDSWSSIPKFHYQLLKFIGLKERNFFGIGHQLDYRYTSV
jgi:hypothetical protein